MRPLMLLLAFVGCGECPSDLPSGLCSTSAMCGYAQESCWCDYGEWRCLPVGCPREDDPAGQSCTVEGMHCHQHFELDCFCRSGTWMCIGGAPPMDDLAVPVESD